MSRQEALQQFRQALKAGQKCYRDCVHRGRYPYPQVLEERLRGCAVAGRVDLGVLDIPIAQIIGTNTAGRQAAFAANFMPLLDEDTEFAQKWNALCDAHLSVGILGRSLQASGSRSARRTWATRASRIPSVALNIWAASTCRRATSA